MAEVTDLEAFLARAAVDDAVYELRPDYRALLIAVDGIEPGRGDDAGEELLRGAEEAAAGLLAEASVEELPHIASWRDAYRGFGAKPQRTRNSLEALTRRAASGALPRSAGTADASNSSAAARGHHARSDVGAHPPHGH